MRKVRGDQNPADLFTKHLASRERVLMLLGLFGCELATGRSEAAPAMRRERLTKKVLGEIGLEEKEEVETVYQILEEAPLPHDNLLPHQHPPEVLEKFFPTMPKPDERVDSLQDFDGEKVDPIASSGVEIAKAIVREAELFGRRRKPVGTAAPYDGSDHKD